MERRVLRMLLASIVWQTHSDCKTGYYHAPEGTTPKLPADHQSRASNLLRNHSRLGDLQNLVRCGYAEDFGTSAQQSVPTLTGISPHVNVLRQNAIMLAEQKRMHGLLVELRENLPSQIARDVRDEIDTFSQEQGNITLTTLQSFQSTLLDKIDGLNGVGSSSNATGAGGVVVVPPKNTQQIQWSDRSFHHLPENYALPKAKLKAAFSMWYSSTTTHDFGYPALRFVGRSDFSDKKMCSKFSSDWAPLFRNLHKKLELEAPALVAPEAWSENLDKNPTEAQLTTMYDKVVSFLPTHTISGKPRVSKDKLTVSYARKFFGKKTTAAASKKKKTTKKKAKTPLKRKKSVGVGFSI